MFDYEDNLSNCQKIETSGLYLYLPYCNFSEENFEFKKKFKYMRRDKLNCDRKKSILNQPS